jgi:hypothetical protein
MTTVIRVGNLEEFTIEIPIPPPDTMTASLTRSPVVRLSLTEKLITRSNGSLPSKLISLHLQGTNDRGEIVWLMEEHRLGWTFDGPLSSREASIYSEMKTMCRLVEDHLRGQGYDVRGGSFGISKSIEPLNGQFECIIWRKNDDGSFTAIAPSSPEGDKS